MQPHNTTPDNIQHKDTLQPDFTEQDLLLFNTAGNMGITPASILGHTRELLKESEPIPHTLILAQLLEKVEPVDFQLLAFSDTENLRKEIGDLEKQLTGANGGLQDDPAAREKIKLLQSQLDKRKLKQHHFLIITIEEILRLATKNKWGLCRNHDFIYLYNGAYWSFLDVEELKTFLGEASKKMGVEKYRADYYQYKEHLFKQFMSHANLPTPQRPKDKVLVNLQNGTFEIAPGAIKLRAFSPDDFITYQLPFEYDSAAKAPLFNSYLDTVLPDQDRQKVLSEYLGYVFIPASTLKLEKTLLLYGSGANGKSVFFEIVNALLGPENTSSYTLQSLTDDKGYHRAKLANILVNYASEINGKLETAIFKQLVSGEPVEARLPYGNPFTLTHYAKLIFNCNELPKDVEHTNAYFRRFMIVPFDITIPEERQDKELSKKIIAGELSGVFNWLLEGLGRLLIQKKFTNCEAIRLQIEQYRKQSDSVQMFMEENDYRASPNSYQLIKELYVAYRLFCQEDGFNNVNKTNFKKRLAAAGIAIEKKNIGNVAFISKATTII